MGVATNVQCGVGPTMGGCSWLYCDAMYNMAVNQVVPTAAFTTLGCKVNQYETQRILESFEGAGYQVVPFDGPADVYVVNSCSVTADAERKSRYTIRRATRFNPLAKVVVTGCAAQMALNQGDHMDGVSLVVPNPEKLDAWSHFAKAFPELVPPSPAEQSLAHLSGRTRATIKIQDGCSVHCSYCSIPSTRPGMRSRPAAEVLAEVDALAERGYQEVVLTGILIGAYGPESGSGGPTFEQLVRQISERIPRVRISSIELNQVTDELLALVSEGKVVPHLHIPLQSGDEGVLQDMNRPYLRADYLARVKELRGISLTTDVIVGFPTETDSRFARTRELFEEVEFLKAHVFTFSPRPGTPAERWGDPISPEVKADRRRVLLEATARSGAAVRDRHLGRTVRVLVEGKERRDGLLEGTSDHYLTVRFAGSRALCRTLQWVHLSARDGETMVGELVSEPGLRVI